MRILVTGGAGFIGSAVIRNWIANTNHTILNVDKLTYAGNLKSLASADQHLRYRFSHADIGDRDLMALLLNDFKPNVVLNLAAETHVDRSIESPDVFIDTNVMGTFNLLEACRFYFQSLSDYDKELFRFHHVSSDEVYGDQSQKKTAAVDGDRYSPSSPYSASKAGGDHLVRAWARTYGLPITLSHCSNNYGPFQFPEKLIPNVIVKALHGMPISIYGDGAQIRDWIYVDDHAQALLQIITDGITGETFNISGSNQLSNIDVVLAICDLLDELANGKHKKTTKHSELIEFVADRPGHDERYAMNSNKITSQLQWMPKFSFANGLRKTVKWYIENEVWWEDMPNGRMNYIA